MEEKPRPVLLSSINYGLITGGAMIVFSLILFLLNLHMNKAVTWVSYVILAGGMVWGTIDYRKKFSNGFLTYGKAFSSCFYIGMIAGILSALYFFVFTKYIHPGFIQEIMDQTRASIATSKPDMSEEQIDQAMEISAKFMTAPLMAMWGFIGSALMSAILGLIAAIFLKKEDPALKVSI